MLNPNPNPQGLRGLQAQRLPGCIHCRRLAGGLQEACRRLAGGMQEACKRHAQGLACMSCAGVHACRSRVCIVYYTALVVSAGAFEGFSGLLHSMGGTPDN
jgi:hypothetical protein